MTAESIGADQVWAGAGDLPKLSGKGVTVAVIDSGIDPKHNALRGRVLATVDFTGGDGVDRFGHGTHVAAIIAGQAGQTADTRMYRGVASGAYLVNLRVLGNDGSGTASDVIEAIDWAIEHQAAIQHPRHQPVARRAGAAAVSRRSGVRGGGARGARGHLRRRGGGELRADGGREDGSWGGITSPGNSPYALTVGALDTQGTAERRRRRWRRSARRGRRGSTW